MPRRHLGSGAARPNTYKIPRRKIAAVKPAAPLAPDSLSEEDRALIAAARMRPVNPRVMRQIEARGLARYV